MTKVFLCDASALARAAAPAPESRLSGASAISSDEIVVGPLWGPGSLTGMGAKPSGSTRGAVRVMMCPGYASGPGGLVPRASEFSPRGRRGRSTLPMRTYRGERCVS